MSARREHSAEGFCREDRADGETAAEALRQRDRVRGDARVLEAKPLAGSSDAGLHLVDEQERAGAIAHFAEPREEARGGWEHAAFALHRLDDDAAELFVHGRFHRVEIAIRDVSDAGDLAEAFAVLGCSREAERAHGAPVKRLMEREQTRAFGLALVERVTARELEERLDRFGARVPEQRA